MSAGENFEYEIFSIISKEISRESHKVIVERVFKKLAGEIHQEIVRGFVS